MNTGKRYKTKQKESILQCIKENVDSYVTIQQIAGYLEVKGKKVGLTTIYRNLEKLELEEKIAKVHIEGKRGSCYRYLEQQENPGFYMKCEKCGDLVDVQCPELEHLYHHISEEHHIFINPGKTMFYGRCEQCRFK